MLRAQRPEKDFIVTSILILLQKEVLMWLLSLFGAGDIALASVPQKVHVLQKLCIWSYLEIGPLEI